MKSISVSKEKQQRRRSRDISLLNSGHSNDFSKYNILELKEEEIELSEGAYHSGTASVIRFVGQKPVKTSFSLLFLLLPSHKLQISVNIILG